MPRSVRRGHVPALQFSTEGVCVMRGLFLSGLLLATAQQAMAAPVVFSGAGGDTAAIQGTVDGFRASLGGVNNGNAPGAQGSGRREINWDGGGAAAPATVFPNPMVNFAGRGLVATTPGSGLEFSGQPIPEFGEINATYSDIFQPFSGPRLFAPIGSTITDVTFNIPGDTTAQALTNAFGVVFADVDFPTTSGIEFFAIDGGSLGTYFAPVANNGLSFLGVTFDSAIIAGARIVTGNAALGPNDGGIVDVVAMDDFIYGEPVAAPIPEPASWAMMILGFGITGSALRRRQRTPLTVIS